MRAQLGRARENRGARAAASDRIHGGWMDPFAPLGFRPSTRARVLLRQPARRSRMSRRRRRRDPSSSARA